MKFVYTVWLSDLALPPDDPDRQWSACFVIDASTATSAKEWGDHIAEVYAERAEQSVISSSAEAVEGCTLPGIESLPVISEGDEATDDEIGW